MLELIILIIKFIISLFPLALVIFAIVYAYITNRKRYGSSFKGSLESINYDKAISDYHDQFVTNLRSNKYKLRESGNVTCGDGYYVGDPVIEDISESLYNLHFGINTNQSELVKYLYSKLQNDGYYKVSRIDKLYGEIRLVPCIGRSWEVRKSGEKYVFRIEVGGSREAADYVLPGEYGVSGSFSSWICEFHNRKSNRKIEID